MPEMLATIGAASRGEGHRGNSSNDVEGKPPITPQVTHRDPTGLAKRSFVVKDWGVGNHVPENF